MQVRGRRDDPVPQISPAGDERAGALRICLRARWTMHACLLAMGIVAAAFTALLLLDTALGLESAGVFMFACACVLAVFAAGFVIAALVRGITVAFHFARFSLGHAFLYVLALNFAILLVVQFPDDLKWMPVLAVALLVLLAWAYVNAQDPTGDNFLAPFVRRHLIARRREAREKERADLPRDGPPRLPLPVRRVEPAARRPRPQAPKGPPPQEQDTCQQGPSA